MNFDGTEPGGWFGVGVSDQRRGAVRAEARIGIGMTSPNAPVEICSSEAPLMMPSFLSE